MNELKKVFQFFNGNLNPSEKHFKQVRIQQFDKQPLTLDDNLFGDITFEYFIGVNINKIGSNVFKKTGNNITGFICYDCLLEQKPPKYNLNSVFNQLTELNQLQIGLDLRYKTLNEILPSAQTNLKNIKINTKELTIKSGAFQYVKSLNSIEFVDTKINRIQWNSFKFEPNNKNHILSIGFSNCNLTNESFQDGSFDGIEKSFVEIRFNHMDINYLPEEAFKSVLDNKDNTIAFWGDSKVDCHNQKNNWLKGNQQIKNLHCKHIK